jgi:hypothetical protein
MKLSELDLSGAAKAIATRIKRAIESAPSNRWLKTGSLLRSVKVVEGADGNAAVVISNDRLKRDPELAQKFADEIMASDLDVKTRDAIAQAVHDALVTENKNVR